ncbi:MAG: META domain-containing protein [Bacteroidetes bacterium]|nr:META domain-containing protein [Bacteroidota bacterium]
MKIKLLLSAALLIVLSSFGVKQKNLPLYETKWSLKKIYSTDGVKDVSTKAFIQFNKDKKTINGNGSCNSYGGSLMVKGKSLKFSKVFSTKMYCQDVQNIEDAFLGSLEKTTKYKIKGDKLFLYQGKKILFQFVAEK